MAALPILREIRKSSPNLEIVLSVTTSSGHSTAMSNADGLFDHLVYYPIDIYRFVLSALVRIRPTVFAVMETELWMNMLDASHQLGITNILVNGRISDRSFPRCMKLKFFYKDLLSRLDQCLMQTETDRDRISQLGATSAQVLGNCKYDQAVEGLDADISAIRTSLGLPDAVPVVVVGSTRSELEETLVATALDGPPVAVVWAPRHVERAAGIKSMLESQGHSAVLRSTGNPMGEARYMILDTFGELANIYAVADVVVIGGGFDNLGGQNLLQALAHGKPVVHGPHMQNFADVAKAAQAAGASKCASTAAELREAVSSLLADEGLRDKMGQSAKAVVTANLGAATRYAEAIVHAAGSHNKGSIARTSDL